MGSWQSSRIKVEVLGIVIKPNVNFYRYVAKMGA
jgi:hypothetical protein